MPEEFEDLQEVIQISLAPDKPRLRFLRGDGNSDSDVNLADAVFTLNWLFGGGPQPGCLAALNTNGDDKVGIADPVLRVPT